MDITGPADGPPSRVGVAVTDYHGRPVHVRGHPARLARPRSDGARAGGRHRALRRDPGDDVVAGRHLLRDWLERPPADGEPASVHLSVRNVPRAGRPGDGVRRQSEALGPVLSVPSSGPSCRLTRALPRTSGGCSHRVGLWSRSSRRRSRTWSVDEFITQAGARSASPAGASDRSTRRSRIHRSPRARCSSRLRSRRSSARWRRSAIRSLCLPLRQRYHRPPPAPGRAHSGGPARARLWGRGRCPPDRLQSAREASVARSRLMDAVAWRG